MESGRLRHRITIKNPPSGYNELGQPLTEWTISKTISAEVNPLIGKEFFAAQQNQDGATVKFNVRYLSGKDITRAMRVSYDNIDYEIIGTPQDVKGLHDEIVIYAKVVSL